MSETSLPSRTLTFDGTREVFEELKIRRKSRYILYRMDESNTKVIVDIVGERANTFAQFKESLPSSDCRSVSEEWGNRDSSSIAIDSNHLTSHTLTQIRGIR